MVIINDNESEKIVNQLNNNLNCGEQTYRASFYLTGIEMGLSPDNIQKLMQATGKDADEIHGLTLTLSESRALCSVQKLLDNTDYKGHTTTKEIPTILDALTLPCPKSETLNPFCLGNLTYIHSLIANLNIGFSSYCVQSKICNTKSKCYIYFYMSI